MTSKSITVNKEAESTMTGVDISQEKHFLGLGMPPSLS